MSAKGKFRSKGEEILKTHPPAPNSIHTFLTKDKPATQPHKSPLAHQPNCTNTHFPKRVRDSGENDINPSTPASEPLVRLHVQIRQDLADRLLERVFQLKRHSGRPKKAASQRAIIEAALEAYFEQTQNG